MLLTTTKKFVPKHPCHKHQKKKNHVVTLQNIISQVLKTLTDILNLLW